MVVGDADIERIAGELIAKHGPQAARVAAEQLNAMIDRNDIRGVLACTDVDRAFIEEHVARLGLQEQWLVCQLEAL